MHHNTDVPLLSDPRCYLSEEERGEDDTEDGDARDGKSARAIAISIAALGTAGGRGAGRSSTSSSSGPGERPSRSAGTGGCRGAIRGGGGGESRVEQRRGVGDTVGRCGHAGGVRDGGDGAERFSGLSVGHDLAILGVSSGEILVLALAGLEGAVLSVAGGVVVAADTVVDVLAEVGGVRAVGVAGLEAELVSTDEAARWVR